MTEPGRVSSCADCGRDLTDDTAFCPSCDPSDSWSPYESGRVQSCALCHHDTDNPTGVCGPCQQWLDDHPDGITREEREAMDNYEGTGL